jgi:hypothetical protein
MTSEPLHAKRADRLYNGGSARGYSSSSHGRQSGPRRRRQRLYRIFYIAGARRELPHMPLGAYSGLAGTVDVGPVFDGEDGDKALVIVYAVDHPVIAPAGAVHSL